MKKFSFLTTLAIFYFTTCVAQKNGYFISGGWQIPVGNFSSTHWGGIGSEIISIKYRCDSANTKKISFTYKAGLSYYFGQRVHSGFFGYDYPAYFYSYVLGGILARPVPRMNIAVTAGPAFSIYNKSHRFNIGAELNANYFIDCNLSVGPSIRLIKENGAAPLFSAGLNLNFRL